jgi:hypothetical protein
MKNPLKQIAFLLVLVGVVSSSVAQQAAKPVKEKVVETYSRQSITFFMGSNPDVNQAPVNNVGKIKFSDKYFNHNLDTQVLPLGAEFKTLTFDKKKVYLLDLMTKQGIGRKIVAKWFNRQANGMMSLDYIHQSGLYNATDQDVKMAVAAKRGDAFLKDAGQNLVNKTSVLILVPYDVKSKEDKDSRRWDCSYDMFCFQLVFTPDVVANFYDVWPYEDDNATIKQNKVAAFDSLNFKFTEVQSKTFQSASASDIITKLKKTKTFDELAAELVNKMYENSSFSLDRSIEDFRVKTKVSRVHPTRAKIGKKEGLKCDQQFFVYQYQYDEATKKVSPVRHAVVRSTSKIVDNRTVATGSSPESKFYQTYGGGIEEGMILQQRLDFGLSVIGGYEVGGMGGGNLNFMFRTGQFTKVTALYLMLDLGLSSAKPSTSVKTKLPEASYGLFKFSIGLGKGMRIGRIFELTPYAQYGVESTSDDTYKEIQTGFIKAGGMLGVNLTHNISLLGQVNYYVPGDISVKKDKDSPKEAAYTGKWDTYFTGRTGVSVMGGLRIEF